MALKPLIRVRETPPSAFPSERGAHEAHLTAWRYDRDPVYINAPSNRIEFEIRPDQLRAIVCRGEYVDTVYFILIGPYSVRTPVPRDTLAVMEDLEVFYRTNRS
jgi:hypothetical protein